MIVRSQEPRLLKLIASFPAVAILGARQVGKTTLAKMLMPKIGSGAVYLDLENPSDLAKIENGTPFFAANRDKCVIIDEVQRRPDFFPMLRSLIDSDRRPGRFVLLGSADPTLLKMSSETLAGRIIYTELTPLNLMEVAEISTINEHWLSGGFPEPFLLRDIGLRTEWFNSFIMTYIERDLPMLGLSTVPQRLLRFVTMLAHSHGQLLNKSTHAKALDLSFTTIANYISYLERAYIVRSLNPFFINLKKRLAKSPKLYLRDSGLLHNLVKITDYNDLLGHPVAGHSWEGYVIEQIISVLGDNFEYFFYRTQDGAECDLVITEKFTPVACVEVKLSSAPKRTKGLSIALQDIGTEKNYIIIPDCPESYPLASNLLVCDLKQFFDMRLSN